MDWKEWPTSHLCLLEELSVKKKSHFKLFQPTNMNFQIWEDYGESIDITGLQKKTNIFLDFLESDKLICAYRHRCFSKCVLVQTKVKTKPSPGNPRLSDYMASRRCSSEPDMLLLANTIQVLSHCIEYILLLYCSVHIYDCLGETHHLLPIATSLFQENL